MQVTAKQKQSSREPHTAQRASVWRGAGLESHSRCFLVPAAGFLSWGPATSPSLSFSSSPRDLRRWSVLWPKVEPVEGYMGNSPSGLGPTIWQLKADGVKGRGKSDVSSPPPGFLPAASPEGWLYALEQPVAWNLWDLVVSSLGYPSPFSPWYLCWQEHKINTLHHWSMNLEEKETQQSNTDTWKEEKGGQERIKLRKDTLPVTFPWNSPRWSHPGREAPGEV